MSGTSRLSEDVHVPCGGAGASATFGNGCRLLHVGDELSTSSSSGGKQRVVWDDSVLFFFAAESPTSILVVFSTAATHWRVARFKLFVFSFLFSYYIILYLYKYSNEKTTKTKRQLIHIIPSIIT